MVKFVAVRDEEAPRSEQDEGAQAKHRKWDSMVIGRESGSGDAGGKGKGKKPHIDRGWGTGQVGWGVQGKFGSNEQDDGSNVPVKRHATGKNKMVRNDKGLWVKASEVEGTEKVTKEVTENITEENARRSTDASRIDERRRPEARQERRSVSPRESRKRQGYAERSYSRRDYSRSSRSPYDSRYSRSRRSRSPHSREDRSRSRDKREKGKRRSPSESSSDSSTSGSSSDSGEEPEFNFTAAQMAENVCEMIGNLQSGVGKVEIMKDMLRQCFLDDVQVLPLSRNSTEEGRWCSSAAELFEEWDKDSKESAQSRERGITTPSKRVFVEIPNKVKKASFCLDLYLAGTAPGFSSSGIGEGQAVAVLYRVQAGKISHVWCGGDHGLASEKMDEDGFIDSKLFVGDVLEIIFESFGVAGLEQMKIHFNDYTDIPTAG